MALWPYALLLTLGLAGGVNGAEHTTIHAAHGEPEPEPEPGAMDPTAMPDPTPAPTDPPRDSIAGVLPYGVAAGLVNPAMTDDEQWQAKQDLVALFCTTTALSLDAVTLSEIVAADGEVLVPVSSGSRRSRRQADAPELKIEFDGTVSDADLAGAVKAYNDAAAAGKLSIEVSVGGASTRWPIGEAASYAVEAATMWPSTAPTVGPTTAPTRSPTHLLAEYSAMSVGSRPSEHGLSWAEICSAIGPETAGCPAWGGFEWCRPGETYYDAVKSDGLCSSGSEGLVVIDGRCFTCEASE